MTFELGINYWPKRTGFWMWREFDIAEVRDDMAHIADMGFDVVRMFALTEDFLTGPQTVDATNVNFTGSLGVGPSNHVIYLPLLRR